MMCWLQITSGRGPEECCWVVARLSEKIMEEATAKGFKAFMLETIPGIRDDTFKSALIAIEGDDAGFTEFVSGWEGTILWIGKSMFRPEHKRKNWFVGVSSLLPHQEEKSDTGEIRIERMRASGPGGQHTNKTESAIRVTHIPTGITASAQEERSQHLNRKLALTRLFMKLKQEKEASDLKNQRERCSHHNTLERGNPVRIFEGSKFELKNKRI